MYDQCKLRPNRSLLNFHLASTNAEMVSFPDSNDAEQHRHEHFVHVVHLAESQFKT
jgi:hypothetical protein